MGPTRCSTWTDCWVVLRLDRGEFHDRHAKIRMPQWFAYYQDYNRLHHRSTWIRDRWFCFGFSTPCDRKSYSNTVFIFLTSSTKTKKKTFSLITFYIKVSSHQSSLTGQIIYYFIFLIVGLSFITSPNW